MFYDNATNAIKAAQQHAPCIIGHTQGKGWSFYKGDSPPPGAAPELLCLALGRLPVPLSDTGAEVLVSVLRAAALAAIAKAKGETP
jgi:hypothetical protein